MIPSSSIRLSLATRGLVVVAALLGASGCSTELAVEGHRVHSANVLPNHIKDYPNVAFQDEPAYLVGSEWFYRDSTYGWVVFDEEPKALHDYRARSAPPPSSPNVTAR